MTRERFTDAIYIFLLDNSGYSVHKREFLRYCILHWIKRYYKKGVKVRKQTLFTTSQTTFLNSIPETHQ